MDGFGTLLGALHLAHAATAAATAAKPKAPTHKRASISPDHRPADNTGSAPDARAAAFGRSEPSAQSTLLDLSFGISMQSDRCVE